MANKKSKVKKRLSFEDGFIEGMLYAASLKPINVKDIDSYGISTMKMFIRQEVLFHLPNIILKIVKPK